MKTDQDAKKITDRIIKLAKTYGQADIILVSGSSSLTRYADNVITQNVHEDEITEVIIRLIKKSGKSSRVVVNQMDEGTIKQALKRASDMADCQKSAEPNRLELTSRQKYEKVDSYVEATARLSPADRARLIKEAIIECKQRNLRGSGTYSNGVYSITVANSKGMFAHHLSTSAEFAITCLSSDSSARATKNARDVNEINTVQLARTAADKAIKAQNAVSVPAGPYTVVLEPMASVEFLFFMAFHGFGALSYQEGRSFLSGKMGKKVMGENINISDDIYHPMVRGMPFDFEGMPKKKVLLIEKGVAKGVVYDRLTAKKAKTHSTGHGLPQPNSHGPLTSALVLHPADSSVSEMIASTKKGLLVSEFHYTNVLDPLKLIITGMTRNGVYLIEDGVVTKGVKNMRFTESVLSALSNVELIARDAELQKGFFGSGGFVAPALKVDNFNFSSETKF
ncbi:MAG: TldD/PmbA family protein [Candidatus Brocadiia bacterium]